MEDRQVTTTVVRFHALVGAAPVLAHADVQFGEALIRNVRLELRDGKPRIFIPSTFMTLDTFRSVRAARKAWASICETLYAAWQDETAHLQQQRKETAMDNMNGTERDELLNRQMAILDENTRVHVAPIDDPRRPTVKLIGRDGNAYAVLGTVVRALKKAGYSPDEVKLYTAAATSGDYDNLLAITIEWVDVK